RPSRHLESRGLPFPSLLGKVARSAGWGVARRFNACRIARPAPRTCIDPDLLSAPHPPLRGTFPSKLGKGDASRLALQQARIQGEWFGCDNRDVRHVSMPVIDQDVHV